MKRLELTQPARWIAGALRLAGLAAEGPRDARAELPPLIPRRVLFDNPPRTGAAISPDGTRPAFIAPSPEGVSNIWVEPLDGGEAVMVTTDFHRGICGFRWAPNGEHLLYIQDRNGDENRHLHAASLETKIVRDLTPFEGVSAQDILADPAHPEFLARHLAGRKEPRAEVPGSSAEMR